MIKNILVITSLLFTLNLNQAETEYSKAKEDVYHGNTETYVFHQQDCRWFDCENCTKVFYSREEAIQSGYIPCEICNP